MVTVGQLIDALYRCNKSAPIPIKMGDGGIVWLTEIKIMNGTVTLIASAAKEAK